MSDLLPIFPLPNVVLFPNVFLPLHIFEPRYREMVADALASDRQIGMVLLRPGWERDYEGRPPVYPIGCSGVITHAERLPDGRYNIVLRGVERFRIVREDAERSYRRAVIDALSEGDLDVGARAAIRTCRAKLESMLTPVPERGGAARDLGGSASRSGEPKMPAAMSDEDLVNALAQYLDLEPLEKQALLEQPCLRSRASSLVELLEMKMMAARSPSVSHVAH
jgi:Lon protease-like protein